MLDHVYDVQYYFLIKILNEPLMQYSNSLNVSLHDHQDFHDLNDKIATLNQPHSIVTMQVSNLDVQVNHEQLHRFVKLVPIYVNFAKRVERCNIHDRVQEYV